MSLTHDRGYCLDCSAGRSLRREEVDGWELFYCTAPGCRRVVKRKPLPVYPQSDQEKARLVVEAKKVDPLFVKDWAAAMHAAIEKAK